MDNEELTNLRNAYLASSQKKEILQGIIEYCKFIKFDSYKTKIMISLITGNLPFTDEKFTDCRQIPQDERDMIREFINEMQ